jgi:transcriptional repressor NrdR
MRNMDCPDCGTQTKTLETRRAEGGGAVRRRRHCPGCGERFTTFERRQPEPQHVVKRDGSRQRFDAEKLRGGLRRAAHKRPVSGADVDAIVFRIATEAERGGGEISSERVRELCLDGLSQVDAGAYLQFAGVELEDLDSVRAELDRIGAATGGSRNPRKKRDSGRSGGRGSVRNEEDAPRPTQIERARGVS